MTIYDVLDKYASIKETDYSRARLKNGYNQYVEKWKQYYKGEVPGINSDTGYNGEETFPIIRRSMKLAKLIAEKWAVSLFTEAFKVTLGTDTETEKFRQLEKQIDFRAKITQASIFGYAEGTTALLASADIESDTETGNTTGGKVKLDIVKYDSIFPLVYDQNDIQSLAFVRQEQKKDLTIYTISIHTIQNNKVLIENVIATVKGENVEFSINETVKQEQTFNNPMYCIIKPNIANDYTDILPFGQSIFADSLAPCEDVDLAADLLRRDVQEGGQVTFIGRDLIMDKIGKNGNKKKLFENTKGKFFVIPQKLAEGGGDIKQLFDKSIPEIRTEQLWQVIKDSLNWACLTSGLGKGSLDIIPMQTATQVVHTEAEKMQNRDIHQQYLECQIIQLVRALCELSTMIGKPIDASEVSITWEDSIVVDTAEQKKLSMLEVDAGLISKAEYRMKYYGETEADAVLKLENIEPPMDNFHFPGATL